MRIHCAEFRGQVPRKSVQNPERTVKRGPVFSFPPFLNSCSLTSLAFLICLTTRIEPFFVYVLLLRLCIPFIYLMQPLQLWPFVDLHCGCTTLLYAKANTKYYSITSRDHLNLFETLTVKGPAFIPFLNSRSFISLASFVSLASFISLASSISLASFIPLA